LTKILIVELEFTANTAKALFLKVIGDEVSVVRTHAL